MSQVKFTSKDTDDIPRLITILGPTAVGKTGLAVNLANAINGEIISADSRQVFRGMDIGTGKDLGEYTIGNINISFHLIDIAEPGSEFSLYNFIEGFFTAHASIINKGKIPILVGGTGLYIDAVLRGYNVPQVNENVELRKNLETKNDAQLISLLKSFKKLHNETDTSERKRLIRAIEIEAFKQDHINKRTSNFEGTPVFGLNFDRTTTRSNITDRLKSRFKAGLIEEVQNLLNSGVTSTTLTKYGLEYKYITNYLLGKLNYDEMFQLLNTAIHQFAKRQMTWFRRMERNGVTIIWLNGEDGREYNLQRILKEIAY